MKINLYIKCNKMHIEEKIKFNKIHDFSEKKIEKTKKKSIQIKICFPTRVLAVGENARGQGCRSLSGRKKRGKNPSLIASGN